MRFKKKTKQELLEMSETELQFYILKLGKAVKEVEADVARLRKQAKDDEIKAAEIRGEIKAQKEFQEFHKKRLGWEGLDDDIITWLADGNYYKYWDKGKYFTHVPSEREIREKYAEVTKLQTAYAKKFQDHPEFRDANGWIDRRGVYHGVGGMAKHDQWAWGWMKEKYGSTPGVTEILKKYNVSYPYEYLQHRLHWVRIMAWQGLKAKIMMPDKPTHAQKQTVDKYCELYEIPLPFDDPLFK